MDNFTIVDAQPHCNIEYWHESKCVIQTWVGLAKSQQFRKSIETTIEFAKTHEVLGIISDTRQQDIVAADDVEWLATVGNPQLFAVGIRRLAFISPNNPFTARGQNNYADKSKDELDIRWFSNPELAKDWFQEAA
jgi:hypothetical protein